MADEEGEVAAPPNGGSEVAAPHVEESEAEVASNKENEESNTTPADQPEPELKTEETEQQLQSTENQSAADENEKAAKIQAMYRGGKGRDKAKQQRMEKEEEERVMNEQATKIQACYRGGKARNEVKEKRRTSVDEQPAAEEITKAPNSISIPPRIEFPKAESNRNQSEVQRKTKWEPSDPNAQLHIYKPTVHPINKHHVHKVCIVMRTIFFLCFFSNNQI